MRLVLGGRDAMANGEFAGRQLEAERKKWEKKNLYSKSRQKNWMEKYDALEGAPQARGIVLAKKGVTQKQPHSGIIKCVRVQLIKNGRQVTAFLPRDGAVKYVDEHDEVIIAGLGGSQRGPKGSMWGVKYQVVMVNGQSLEELRSGRKEKVKR